MPSQGPTYEPTPDEIRRECERIRATWTDADKARRLGLSYAAWLALQQQPVPELRISYRRRDDTHANANQRS